MNGVQNDSTAQHSTAQHSTAQQIIAVLLTIIFALVSARLILRGTGLFSHLKFDDIAVLASFILLLTSSKKSFYFILLPIITIYSLYLPIGMNYGYPRYQHIISAIATDFTESEEFLSLIPAKHYLYAIAVLVMIILIRWIIRKVQINYLKNKTFLITVFLLCFLQLKPFSFFTESYKEYKLVQKEMNTLNGFSQKNDWGKSELLNSKYDNYVLVIGESVRQDYLHAYGYPIENTPFLDNVNGTFVDGLYAAGGYTIGSLRLMLTKPDTKKWEPNYNLNFINMIKSAGIKTYWLSNQGFIGPWDTPITGIANSSDIKFFLKSGEYNSKNTSDFELLPKFEQWIKQQHNDKRFFVLHLYGSHLNACDRVKDYGTIFEPKAVKPEYAYINCYISSIKKTDEFLQRAYNILKQSGQSFSMIYFSDHGLGHKNIKNQIYLNNASDLKKGDDYYKVPLIKMSSDDDEHTKLNSFKSGLNFTEGLANWIGIKNQQIDASKDLFSGRDDPTDYGQREKRIPKNVEDKAINITP